MEAGWKRGVGGKQGGSEGEAGWKRGGSRGEAGGKRGGSKLLRGEALKIEPTFCICFSTFSASNFSLL